MVETETVNEHEARAQVWVRSESGLPIARAWKCTECSSIRLPSRHAICRVCLSESAKSVPLNGKATVYSKTVVHRGFPGTPVPYTVVIVDLVEGIRLRTVVVGEGAADVQIGDQVNLAPAPGATEIELTGLAVTPCDAQNRLEVSA